ncbi:hypothetical protein [Flavobacterium rhizosphaerae]|uniref:Lipocalin-like domain-containing protein n=1 Tax=Flavobacterium rhizosphaerae TaxID=3163298 RepID=A0ABW8YXH2_9FLAO
MKLKVLLLLLAAATLTSFTYSQAKEFDIVGTWQATNNDQKFILTFDKEGYATLQKGGEIIGGKEFTLYGEKGSMTYKLNYAKDPDEIDITIRQNSTGREKVIKGIFKVISLDEMLLAMDFDNRPANFDSAEVRLFKKVK